MLISFSLDEDVGDEDDVETHSHKDGAGHGDGIERVEECWEEVNMKAGFKTKSPQLFRIRCLAVVCSSSLDV